MARTAKAAGYRYLALTDHSHYLRDGRMEGQWREIAEVNERVKPFRVLKGVEANIRSDGTIDVSDDALAELDWVVASLHSAFDRNPTERILAALDNPHVDSIGHLTGRKLNRRPGADVDVERVVARAVETRTALEINSQPDRLDMRDVHARLAGEAGVLVPITTDAHFGGGARLPRARGRPGPPCVADEGAGPQHALLARGRRAPTRTLELAEQRQHPVGALDDDVGCREQRGRRLGRVDRDAHAELEPVETRERVDVRRIVAGVERTRDVRALHERRDGGSLVRLDRRPHFEHHPAPAGHEPLGPRSLLHSREVGAGGRLVLRAPEVERHAERLALGWPVDARRERRDPVGPCGGLRRQLEAVLADDCDAGNPDEALDVGAGATADAGDERVARGEPRELVPGLLRDPRVLGPLDDRRERAVDVEEDRGPSAAPPRAVGGGRPASAT